MGSTDTTDDAGEPIHETTPSTKLVKLWLALTVLVGVPLTAYLLAVPDAFGTDGFGGVAGIFVGLLTAIGVGRYGVRWLVLRRTRYVVTEHSVRREYELLYRTFSRELPLGMLRSVELSRSRTESLLGLGSVRMLTTGSGRGMGYLGFANVGNPGALRDAVRDQRSAATARETAPEAGGWERASRPDRPDADRQRGTADDRSPDHEPEPTPGAGAPGEPRAGR